MDVHDLPYRCPKCIESPDFHTLSSLRIHLGEEHSYHSSNRQNGGRTSPLLQYFEDNNRDLEQRLQAAKAEEDANRRRRTMELTKISPDVRRPFSYSLPQQNTSLMNPPISMPSKSNSEQNMCDYHLQNNRNVDTTRPPYNSRGNIVNGMDAYSSPTYQTSSGAYHSSRISDLLKPSTRDTYTNGFNKDVFDTEIDNHNKSLPLIGHMEKHKSGAEMYKDYLCSTPKQGVPYNTEVNKSTEQQNVLAEALKKASERVDLLRTTANDVTKKQEKTIAKMQDELRYKDRKLQKAKHELYNLTSDRRKLHQETLQLSQQKEETHEEVAKLKKDLNEKDWLIQQKEREIREENFHREKESEAQAAAQKQLSNYIAHLHDRLGRAEGELKNVHTQLSGRSDPVKQQNTYSHPEQQQILENLGPSLVRESVRNKEQFRPSPLSPSGSSHVTHISSISGLENTNNNKQPNSTDSGIGESRSTSQGAEVPYRQRRPNIVGDAVMESSLEMDENGVIYDHKSRTPQSSSGQSLQNVNGSGSLKISDLIANSTSPSRSSEGLDISTQNRNVEQSLNERKRLLKAELQEIRGHRKQLRQLRKEMTGSQVELSESVMTESMTSFSKTDSEFDQETDLDLVDYQELNQRMQSMATSNDTKSLNNRRRKDTERINQVLFCVFMYLDTRELTRMACICKIWRDVSRHPALWRKVVFSNTALSNKFLRTMPNWATQIQSLALENIRGKPKRPEETIEDYRRNTRGQLESGLEYVMQHAQETLISLRVVNCTSVLTDRCLWLASCHCRHLERVAYISASDPVGTEVMWALGAGCRSIKTLIVPPAYPNAHPSRFNNRCASMIGKCWPEIQVLCIGGIDIGIKGLTSVVKNCPRLQILEFDHMCEVTDTMAVAMCAAGLQGIEVLDFTFTPVAPKAAAHFISACPHLKTLNINVGISDYFHDTANIENRRHFDTIIGKLRNELYIPGCKSEVHLSVRSDSPEVCQLDEETRFSESSTSSDQPEVRHMRSVLPAIHVGDDKSTQVTPPMKLMVDSNSTQTMPPTKVLRDTFPTREIGTSVTPPKHDGCKQESPTALHDQKNVPSNFLPIAVTKKKCCCSVL